MKRNIFMFLLSAAAASTAVFHSCDNMDATYIQYLTEQNYSGKVTDLKAYAGTGRVLLTWTNPKDQISKKIRIVYGEDEQEVTYESLVSEAYIDGLTLGSYEFTVYTMDAKGNLSIPVSITKSLFTQSHLSNMDAPRCTASLQEDGSYTLRFTGISNSMMMFGGEFEYKLAGSDGYTHADTYEQEVNTSSLTSKFVNVSFTNLPLQSGATYEVEYSVSAYPANLKSISMDNTYSYTEVSIDKTTVSGKATLYL